MKRVLVALSLAICYSARGQVPHLINYQGRLLTGTNLVNGTVALSLRIFDAPTAGALLYEDSNSVTVVDGLYSTFLGDNTTTGSLATALAATNAHIEVMVNGTALAPREHIASVSYALLSDGVKTGGITTAMIADGAITAAKLASNSVTANKLASNSVTTAALADGAVTSNKVLQAQEAPAILSLISDPNGRRSDTFGACVAAVGSNRFVAGAPLDDTGTTNAGVAYLFDYDGKKLVTITNPTPGASDQFGFAVTGMGTNRFVVTAVADDTGASGAGSAYLYDFNGMLLATITNPAPAINDDFGYSAAAVGSSRFVIGAPFDSAGAIVSAGRVFLYDVDGTLITTVTNPFPSAGDLFGYAVGSVGTNRFVVGAIEDSNTVANSGRAFLYDMNGALVTSINNPAPGDGDFFGSSVAGVGQNQFVIGAERDSLVTSSAGSAFLYDFNGNLLATITNPEPAVQADFGSAVAPVGTNYFVVGAFEHRVSSGSIPGAAYLFDLNGTPLATIPSPAEGTFDSFGDTAAGLGSNRFVIGAPGAGDHGNVYVFEIHFAAGGIAVDTAGTVSGFIDPEHYSAYRDLQQEGYLNNDDSDDLLLQFQADARYFNTNDSIRTIDGSVTNPAHSFANSRNAGMFLIASNDIGFATAGTQRLAIAANGNVDIGTNAPLEKLDVEGNLLVEGFPMIQSTSVAVTNDETLTPASGYIRMSSSLNVTLNTTIAISSGSRIGQVLILQCSDSVNTMTIPDNANTHLSGNFTMTNDSMLQLIWDGADWNEISESKN